MHSILFTVYPTILCEYKLKKTTEILMFSFKNFNNKNILKKVIVRKNNTINKKANTCFLFRIYSYNFPCKNVFL